MTYFIFRSWHRQCVGCQGGEKDCHLVEKEERTTLNIRLDHVLMGDEKEGNTPARPAERERGRFTKAVLRTAAPRKSTGEWICTRLVAWLRETGLEPVVSIVNSNSERWRT